MIECGVCKVSKPEGDFYKSSKRSTGRQYSCKPCQAKTNLKRYHEKLSTLDDYKSKKSAYDKKRRKEKGDEIRAYDRERSKLPHRKAAHNEETRRRRAAIRDAIPEDYDKEGVVAMYQLAQKLSKLTDVEMHVDHKIPISRGGEHNVKNLQILAGKLNVAKGATDKCYFPKEYHECSWETYP